MVIPDFLELVDLPENAVRRYLITVLDAQIAALAECRDDSGLWHTLLDDPHSYLEASATAGFAYGILKAVRKRYVGQHYAGVAEKRFAGLCRIFRRRGCCRPHLAPGWGQTSTFIARSRLPRCPTVRRWRSFV